MDFWNARGRRSAVVAQVLPMSGGVAAPAGDGGGAPDFLWRCSEMGARLAALDWSRTPLGLPHGWPGSLRAALGLCLTSRLPTHLWWGPDLTVLYNDGCVPLLGPGQHPRLLARPAREAWTGIWDRIGPLIAQVLGTGLPAWAEEAPEPLVGGGAVPMGLAVSPVYGRDGAVEGLFCTCLASTAATRSRALAARSPGLEDELMREAQRMAREIDELREAHRQKDAFLATLAHELRNPLAPIRNAVRFMRLRGTPDRELLDAQGMIERQADQLVRLLDDLMEISRIRRGRIHLQLQRVDLGLSIATAVEASRALIDAAGHTLVVDLPGHPLPVEGDPARLSQIFANLLNNAAKYTPAGGRIELSARIEGSLIAVRITDTGVGIPKDMLQRIFEMFTQVDASLARRQGGLGIGLTVAQQLVLLHGGRIEAGSEGEHRGSTFTVTLPQLQGRPADARSTAKDPAPRVRPRRVLIADDHPDAAESLSILLRMAGHTVHTAGDGLMAVHLAQELQPDVVLLDIGMPELDGYGAAQRIRALPHGEHILLLALTGWGGDSDRQQAARAGFDYHLTKPVDPELLERILADSPPP